MNDHPVSSVGVVGGGTMGVGIAYVFSAAGCAVTLVERGDLGRKPGGGLSTRDQR